MELLEEIKSLALRAGALALGDRDTAGPEVACESKATATDIVTATDRRVEAFVVEAFVFGEVVVHIVLGIGVEVLVLLFVLLSVLLSAPQS